MAMKLQTFQQLLQRMAGSLQRALGDRVDLTPGTILRAILEANASIGLWMQWLLVQTLRMTRATTSSGGDLDSWMADFSLVRQPPIPARGVVTFSRLSAINRALVPLGTEVRSPDGSAVFTVTQDAVHPAWNGEAGAYELAPGVLTMDVPVTAVIAGMRGNIAAGVITLISSVLPGVEFVNNATAMTGGADGEDDAQFRRRFQDYINSRSLATVDAVDYAVQTVAPGIRHKIFDSQDASGNWMPGQFLVVADDGAGTLPSDTMTALVTAVDAVRPIGVRFNVVAPSVTTVDLTVTFSDVNRQLAQGDASAVASQLAAFINTLPIGTSLSLTRIIETAYRAVVRSPDITGVLINGSPSDLVASPRGVFRAGLVTVH